MARGEEISLPSFPFSPETLDTQAKTTDVQLVFNFEQTRVQSPYLENMV